MVSLASLAENASFQRMLAAAAVYGEHDATHDAGGYPCIYHSLRVLWYQH